MVTGTDRMGHRREIDGLRALAIVPVVLFHAGLAGFSGGFVGVDVFFVLSGYLITGILLRSLEQDRYSILDFYERRARRILPALLTVALLCLPAAWRWMEITSFKNFGESLTAVSAFASNVLFWREDNYFGVAGETKPLLHTWSLAVEEQFYIFFPLLVAFVMRRRPAALPWVLAGIGVASLAAAEWGWREAPSANFFLFQGRAWELLIGAGCAMAQRRGIGLRGHDGLAFLGLAMVLGTIPIFDAETPFPSLLALIPAGGTALVVCCARAGTRAARLLAWGPFVAIGLVSYSAYLIHQPLLAFARILSISETPPLALMLGLGALSFPLGWLSWRFVEGPFRHRGAGAILPGRRFLVASAAALAVLGGIGVVIHLRAAALSPMQPDALLVERLPERMRTWDLYWSNPALREELSRFPEKPADRPVSNVLIVGDSHAKDLFNALYANRESFPDFAFRFTDINGDCYAKTDLLGRPAADPPACLTAFAKAGAAKLADADWILLSVRWSLRRQILPWLPEIIRDYEGLGMRVALAGNAPEFHDSIKYMRRLADRRGRETLDKATLDRLFTDSLDPEIDPLNARLEAIAAETGAVWLDKTPIACPGAPRLCDAVTPDMRPMRIDTNHNTVEGAAMLGARMAGTGWLARLRP